MKWIETTGGPVVLLPASQVSLWNGSEADHYERAGEVQVYTGLIWIGETGQVPALSIGAEPLRTYYLDDIQAVVQWCWADSEDGLLDLARRRIADADWEEDKTLLSVHEDLILFDAVYAGTEILSGSYEPEEEPITIRLAPGTYRVRTTDIDEGRTCVRLHQFVRTDE